MMMLLSNLKKTRKLPLASFNTSSIANRSSSIFRNFSTDNTSTSDTPSAIDFEAPKDDRYKNFQSTNEFMGRYILLFPLAFYCLYKMAFVTKNQFSDRNEFKVVNKSFEISVFGPIAAKRFKNKFGHLYYKNDTEEAILA